ncbi:DUF5936 domain-containing protein, partial [Streptomyces sp. NPDC048717]
MPALLAGLSVAGAAYGIRLYRADAKLPAA